ncbi:MAG: hypothetical protein ACYDIA_01890 [Candidatus Humimicrobiaceae bacterium]
MNKIELEWEIKNHTERIKELRLEIPILVKEKREMKLELIKIKEATNE